MINHRYISCREPAVASAPKAYYDGGYYGPTLMADSCTVSVEDRFPEDTGLFDANGDRLYRLPETVKIGFHLS